MAPADKVSLKPWLKRINNFDRIIWSLENDVKFFYGSDLPLILLWKWLILYESYHKNRQKPINSLSFGCEIRICGGP